MKTLYLAESYPLLLASMNDYFARQQTIRLVGSGGCFKQLAGQLDLQPPDCLVLDAELVPGELADWLRQARLAWPDMSVVLVFAGLDRHSFRRGFSQNVHGLLPKSATAEEMLGAVRVAQAGEHYVHPAIRDLVSDRHFFARPTLRHIDRLSQRELEVLQLIVDEFTTREIADQLYISACTVETHRLHLIQKLGVKNTAGLVREALVQQLLPVC